MNNYLIWSNEHRAWWRPGHNGYTNHVSAAGRYDVTQNFKYLKSTACLTKIKTPSAKAYFLERWRKWKGLEVQS